MGVSYAVNHRTFTGNDGGNQRHVHEDSDEDYSLILLQRNLAATGPRRAAGAAEAKGGERGIRAVRGRLTPLTATTAAERIPRKRGRGAKWGREA
jgi:hypothetical protein